MSYSEFTLHISLALFLGLCIGLERQLTGHVAGIRINVLICLGASFFTSLAILLGPDEVFRIAAYLISGVSFLCSAVIFKENGSVRGMNTAATLWCTAAIGILATTKAYICAIIAAFILIATNLILRPVANKINPINAWQENENVYQISVICSADIELDIRRALINLNNYKKLYITNLESGDVIGDKVEVLAKFSSFGKNKYCFAEDIVNKVLLNPKVASAGWEILE